jgi:hypothetical protein
MDVVAKMMPRLAIIVFAFLIAVPAFPDVRQSPTGPSQAALRVMSNNEFTLFLGRLDTGLLRWKAQLSRMDIRSVSLDSQEGKELERTYNLCLQSLDNARQEIQNLSSKQTLKLDFLLLLDLNDLARNLDELSRNLTNVAGRRSSAAEKSLGYAREVLGSDVALAPYLVEFQRHLLAFAAIIDATSTKLNREQNPPQTQD